MQRQAGLYCAMKQDAHADIAQEAARPRKRVKNIAFWGGLVLMVLSLISGFATYFILTGLTPIPSNSDINNRLLWINVVLVLAMIALISWHIIKLWVAQRKQAAAANLHVRILALFSVVAALPAILLTVFASISLDRGLNDLFSRQTQTIIRNSIIVAETYIEEHSSALRINLVSMGEAIDRVASLQTTDKDKFDLFLKNQSRFWGFPMALLVDENGQVLKVASNRIRVRYQAPPKRAFELVKKGGPVVITPTNTNNVSGLTKLDQFRNTYLYVMRPVNPNVVKHLNQTRARVRQYKRLQNERINIQFSYGLMQLAIALTLLLAAVWIGLWFANRLVTPIRRLITAAENVSQGNLDERVKVRQKEGDLAKLSSTFNNMTFRLRTQRDELINANTVIDDRRRFMEAVLSGVTAGVLGVDAAGIITLTNPSAVELLGVRESDLIDASLQEVSPAFFELWTLAQKEHSKKRHEEQVDIIVDGVERHFAVRVTQEKSGDHENGYVITFDDITELVAAQRNTAWADIARRIAHEIKNPLTPIQLSAERIRRKYGDSLGKDRTVFDQCTDTIVRQVGDIGRMVDEFSSFARMPEPTKKEHDIRNVVRDAFILFQSSQPDIAFKLDTPDEPVFSLCDERLLSQAVTNLVKNASEAISSVIQAKAENNEVYQGRILIRMKAQNNEYRIEVIDNGCGLPETNRNKLVEPYMTTREKGTGLGLAIVQKITEQHGGALRLSDAPEQDGFEQGACVRLSIPIISEENASSEKKNDKLSSGSESTTLEQVEANENSAEENAQ